MKPWFLAGLVLAVLGPLGAEPTILVNTLADRPVFSLVSDGVTLTRTVAPGQRVSLNPGTYSGLGEKKVPLEGGRTYYWARFEAVPALYVLGPDQFLVLNQAGRALTVTLGPATSVLAAGALVLGSLGTGEAAEVRWDDGTVSAQATPPGPGLYRLVLDSPEGTGTRVSLVSWN